MDTHNTSFDPVAWLSQSPEKPQPIAVKSPLSVPSACQSLTPAEELAKATAVTHELIALGANIAESYIDFVRLGNLLSAA